MSPEQLAFLGEYQQLCMKYKKIITSCGCCNSPWVEEATGNPLLELTSDQQIAEHVEHLKGGVS